MRRLLTTGCAAACLLAPAAALAPPAAAVPASYAIDQLNAEREANGIPGQVLENPDWSARCAKHVAYETKTSTMTHFEDPSSPYYTPEGDWAGRSSVLSGAAWSATGGNPWEDAPIHLDQLLQPGLTVTGYADDGQFACMVTWPGVSNSGVPEVFTVPGDHVKDVPVSEDASGEGPTNPAEQVGLARDALTGPNLIVYYSAAKSIASATLVGPDGPVEVRVMDNTGPYGAYIAPGGILVPVKPLAPDSDYTASVVINTASGGQITPSWDFHAALLANTVGVKAWPASPVGEQSDGSLLATRGIAKVRVSVTSTAPQATLTATSAAGAKRTQKVSPGAQDDQGVTLTLSLTSGVWRICLASGGPGTGYQPATTCNDQLVRIKDDTQKPLLRVHARRYAHNLVRLFVYAWDNSALDFRVRYRLGNGAWRTPVYSTNVLRHAPRNLRITVDATDASGNRAVKTLVVA
jgi:hypothetical protein